ncbi:hypothetical protein P8Q88_11250 [Qipengyuania sp. XHP0207]|uniref:hypothetical protein n=1 Tax=Qipengyuania sp. XHP0207 TaxID=3038078 RepID=UPI00241EDD9E|nr:hypothetical protein [Qipengyuania sp. XHP0207]MDG5748749.1 hypothetical protein [Qipengyuania sp. XHP0207]
MTLRFLATIAPLAVLAACGSGPDGGQDGDTVDPASEQALNDGLATDPDLSGQNEAGAALSGTGSAAIPQIDKSEEAIAAARDRASQMVGGAANLKPAPAAKQLAADAPDTAAMVAAARAAVQPGGTNCAQSAEYGSAWAAKLPTAFPVYPRGNTQEAAGTDEGECALRVVSFYTPVALNDVFAFYSTRAREAGFNVEHTSKGGDNILSGTKGQSAYVIYGRRLDQGVTQIDLVTSN